MTNPVLSAKNRRFSRRDFLLKADAEEPDPAVRPGPVRDAAAAHVAGEAARGGQRDALLVRRPRGHGVRHQGKSIILLFIKVNVEAALTTNCYIRAVEASQV